MSRKTRVFLAVMSAGYGLIGLQALCAWFDGYWSQDQLQARGIVGYSFLQHGGMWSDIVIITPVMAWILSRYRLRFFSWPSLLTLAVVAAVVLAAAYSFVAQQRKGNFPFEAYVHDGYTPPAGWLHILYAISAFWACAMFYLGLVDPPPRADVWLVSRGLTIWAIFGIMKFSSQWHWDATAMMIVIIEVALIWGLTICNPKIRH